MTKYEIAQVAAALEEQVEFAIDGEGIFAGSEPLELRSLFSTPHPSDSFRGELRLPNGQVFSISVHEVK